MIPVARFALVLPMLLALQACGGSGSASAVSGSAKLRVVAAENVWGSIASQLGGSHASVTSVVTNPDTDPHDYEATPADGRAIASAQYVIVNGGGYDAWASKLLDANPVNGRVVLTVCDLVGVKEGGNPHRWYSPPDVMKVIDQITADYKRLDPADAAYFDSQHATYINQALAPYTGLVSAIKSTYAGTPVGASESIFSPLSDALGLKLLTPAGFLDAISEGADPTEADKAAIDAQIRNKQIKVYVYNSQNATPDVTAQVAAAKAQGIPVTTLTETLEPASATFQDWQVSQLRQLQAALAAAPGK